MSGTDEHVATRIPASPHAHCVEMLDATTPEPQTPLLAIVIPCYNYEAYVGSAIDSVTSQQGNDVELVVVDDGSQDASWDVISRAGVRSYRLKNSGPRRASLFGLAQTSAPFVLFLDADDELAHGALKRLLPALAPDVAKVQFPLENIDSSGEPSGGSMPMDWAIYDREALVKRVLRSGTYSTPPTSGNVFRRDLCAILEQADYDLSVDGVMSFAAPFMGKVVSFEESLGRYRIHGENLSGLGRAPAADLLERDARIFEARMSHLRRILEQRDDPHRLKSTRKMFYFQERMFYATVARGQRPSVGAAARLLTTLARESQSLKVKCALAMFFALAPILPPRRSQTMLEYRLTVGDRSARGLLREIVK